MDDSMGEPTISRNEVFNRFQGTAFTNYLTLFGVMKGVAAAAAAVSLLSLLTEQPVVPYLLLLWTVAFVNLIMTYEAMLSGTILAYWRPTWRDAALSFMVGLTEFTLFSLLLKDFRSVPGFFLVLSIHGFSGGSLAVNDWWQVQKVHFESALTTIVQVHARRQLMNSILAGLTAFFFAFVAVRVYVIGLDRTAAWSLWVAGLVALGSATIATISQELDIRSIAKGLQ